MSDNIKAVLILIAIVAGGAVVVFLDERIAAWFAKWADSRREAQPLDDAGIGIAVEQGDFIPDLRKPHYPNGCGCADCASPADAAPAIIRAARRPRPYVTRWSPTDAEIEQFLNNQNGGTQ